MLARVDGVRRLRVFFSAAKEGCRLARPLSSGAAFLAVLSIWVEAAASLRKTDAALRALGPANAIYLRIYAAAQNPSNFEDEPKPSNASTRSPYTKGLAVCQIQDPYEEAESYSVIRRARHYCKQTWPSGNHQCQRFSHVHIRPSRANVPSIVKNYDAAVEITALQLQQAAAISRPQDYKKQ